MKDGACSPGTSTCIYKHALLKRQENEPDLWHYDELFGVNKAIISICIGLQIYKIPVKNGCCRLFRVLLLDRSELLGSGLETNKGWDCFFSLGN